MRESIVTYQPIGRLGNQMFQLAAAIGYARKYNAQYFAPYDTKEVPGFHTFFNVRKYDGNEFRRYNQADPSQFNYSPIPEFKHGVKLVGFFQSEKWFEGAHDEIRKVFHLNIQPIDAVSIHVRRGDYVVHANSFPPVNDDFLIKAMSKAGGNKFIFFSDDIKWCQDFAHRSFSPFDNIDISFSEGRNEIEDLSLMASCSHHIIANSTFSWWGAWLGHNPDKIVVSPHYENWFGPGFTGAPPKDIIPDSWHQIKFR